jgi:hypothetical protein
MSDSEEHHFESKADAGASKTYPQQAGTVRKNGYVVIKGRPFSSAVLSLSSGTVLIVASPVLLEKTLQSCWDLCISALVIWELRVDCWSFDVAIA